MTLFSVAFGGLIGVLFRYCILVFVPLPTVYLVLFINCIGSFIIGYNYNTGVMLPFLAIGFCGAFTTFSTYSLDALKFILQGQWLLLFMHVVLSIFFTIF